MKPALTLSGQIVVAQAIVSRTAAAWEAGRAVSRSARRSDSVGARRT